MGLNIGLAVVTYNQQEGLRRMIASAWRSIEGTDHKIRMMIYDHGIGNRWHTEDMELEDGSYHIIQPPGGNATGIATSWNNALGILYGPTFECDAAIICNDDIEFGIGDIERIATETAEHREGAWWNEPVRSGGAEWHGKSLQAAAPGSRFVRSSDIHIVTVTGIQEKRIGGALDPHLDSIGYSCFGYTRAAWEELGAFDANFFPAYFEDCDMEWRAKLAGMHEINIPSSVRHFGSMTTLSDPAIERQNGRTYAANLSYYIKKWGGENGHETCSTPFNMGEGDTRNGVSAEVISRGLERAWRIPPGKRFAPYGSPYDRSSEERAFLVKI